MHSATFIAIIQCELINISAAAIEIYLYTYISGKYNARDTPTFFARILHSCANLCNSLSFFIWQEDFYFFISRCILFSAHCVQNL